MGLKEKLELQMPVLKRKGMKSMISASTYRCREEKPIKLRVSRRQETTGREKNQ